MRVQLPTPILVAPRHPSCPFCFWKVTRGGLSKGPRQPKGPSLPTVARECPS